MKLSQDRFKTLSYKMIEDLTALDKSQSEELSRTVELGNPLAREIHTRFTEQTSRLIDELSRRDNAING